MAGGHAAVAGDAVKEALEQGAEAIAQETPLGLGMSAQKLLHLMPESVLDDGDVFADVDFVLVADPAHVSDPCEQLVQAALRERVAAALETFACPPALVDPAAPVELLDHP